MKDQEEEILLKKRFIDLSRLADKRDIVTFSNFLNLNEINLFYQITSELVTQYQLFGGYEFAERQMVAFISDALSYAQDTSDIHFPISCLKFVPANPKFAEELTHRDILGALMSLGIERSKIGDIRVDGDTYYVFCEEELSGYLLDALTMVRHTAVRGEAVAAEAICIQQKFQEIEGIVSSNRIDGIVAFLTGKARAKSATLIQGQKVFLNERTVVSNSQECKENDVISIRGYGKYVFLGCSGETRKGRVKIHLKKYV
ncbi:MAG: YlmH/Sll1252 family protein [Roseburia sp.]|nr:YlmH/Sll1252 family protein [Roseburia sp.]